MPKKYTIRSPVNVWPLRRRPPRNFNGTSAMIMVASSPMTFRAENGRTEGVLGSRVQWWVVRQQ